MSVGCAAADNEWLGKATVHNYLSNDMIIERMGSNEHFDNVVWELITQYTKRANDLPPITDEAIQMVILFNDVGDKKIWVINENDSQQQSIRDLANQVLGKLELKTLSGVLGFSLAFKRVGQSNPTSTRPPIPKEWDTLISKNKRISASDLFQLLLEKESAN